MKLKAKRKTDWKWLDIDNGYFTAPKGNTIELNLDDFEIVGNDAEQTWEKERLVEIETKPDKTSFERRMSRSKRKRR